MDTDLFQGVLLGLLAVGIIVLVALLATLGGIRKALVQRSAQPAETGPEPTAAEPGAATEAEPAPAAETQAEPASGGYTGAGSYATPRERAAGPSSGERAASIRSVLEGHGAGAGATPAEETAPAAAEQEGAVDSVFAAHADDPQEEPFQREGSWWFRRGDELLLYDDASGQWQPAPEGSLTMGATTAGEAAAPAATTAAETTAQTESMPAVADEVATFWKCPTCGAVNGSTAATCRMCFAARP